MNATDIVDITTPEYDICREWIKNSREKKLNWEEIKLCRRKDENGLEQFLQNQIFDSYWPSSLTTRLWFEIVKSEKEAEERSQNVFVIEKGAALVDDRADANVKIPADRNSSWQLYKRHLEQSKFSKESINEIEQATLAILKRLNNDTTQSEPIKGMVVGHVQSGKTANMAALMAMAADWGWNMFIVLSGTIENLRRQTQERLLRDLNHPGNINWIGLEHLSKRSALGSRIQDLRLEQGANPRYFNVCLKNSGRLKNLIEWMQQDPNKYKQLKVIVIDDEADQASVNTADIHTQERKKINGLIVNLVEGKTHKGTMFEPRVKSMNYISYTATPYANFLNESSLESLYPRNFIRMLEPSNEYFGAKQIFGIEGTDDCDGLNIVREITDIDYEELRRLHKGDTDTIPQSLKDAICWFLCSAAAMRYLGHKKPISMLIHTSQKQDHHKLVSDSVRKWIKNNKEHIVAMCKELWDKEKRKFTIDSFKATYPNYGRINEIRNYPNFDDILMNIRTLLTDITHISLDDESDLQYHEGIHLCVDNCANNGVNEEGMHVRLAYPDPGKEQPKPAPAFIIVGGSTLSRGLTIEGLVSTYFLRSSCQADTLMQMGRWFGYRRGYELLPRLWMTKDTLNKFKLMAVIEHELRADLHRFMHAGVEPKDYGPRILNSPDMSWLRITANNKMQSMQEIEMDFTGTNVQTFIFENNKEILEHNVQITEQFLKKLEQPSKFVKNSAVVWKGIKFDEINNSLFKEFRFHERTRVLNSETLSSFVEWVEKVSDEENLNDWNIIAAGIEPSDDKSAIWKIGEHEIGKVNRSRKTDIQDENIINIGVLRAPRDLLADVPEDDVNSSANTANSSDISMIRANAGLDKTPQLLIYRIDKNSKARDSKRTGQKDSNRADLNAVEDIIGINVIIPGSKGSKPKAKALTIKLNNTWGEEE
ncbi:hypothetical protein J45TS6_08310 [Paenibacillus sp. J45TS6]|uniref:Z1 domain-containing protein n=1 Tax=Paenibacillus sp. J45TS6 TaxID=2807196 RepID=UPI001B28EC5F|nr:Z1 domain-containing protein [Paenibacillus sp. J45TS6]GIP42372.1 hypothetical protein J45TS6_08310 [Paenibacillus sp. J45TS6]